MYIPTQITKLNDKYFIVDCYHHRIIYSSNLFDEIKDWRIIPIEFAGCHSICSDGDIYVIDNTGRNQIIVCDLNFKKIQTIENVGVRPHKALFDNTTQCFYVYSSGTSAMYCYKNIGGKLVPQYSKFLTFLTGMYCRSVNIIHGYMYFIENLGRVFKTNYTDGSYDIIEIYNMPTVLTPLADINKFGNYFYISVMGGNLVRAASLDFSNSSYEVLYSKYGFLDNSYFISFFDDKIYFTEVGETQNSIIESNPNNADDFNIIYRKSGIISEDGSRRELYPR